MFKYIDFYIKTRCTIGVRVFFPRASMQSCNSACMTKSSLVTENKCVKLHMRVLEIAIHHNVDN